MGTLPGCPVAHRIDDNLKRIDDIGPRFVHHFKSCNIHCGIFSITSLFPHMAKNFHEQRLPIVKSSFSRIQIMFYQETDHLT